MMNEHELIKNAFESIAPSEELIEKVKSGSFVSEKRFSGISKRIAVPVMICFALCLGITAAAAGNFDIYTLFGDMIKVADSELAEELKGKISNVNYSVSDDDYKVSVIGATGDSGSLMAVIEISRKDGSPAADHFENAIGSYDDEVYWLSDSTNIKSLTDITWSGGIGTAVSENGNILYAMDISASDSISGKTISAEGDTLMLYDEYTRLTRESNSYYGMNKGECGFFDCDTHEPVEVDISSAVALPLTWSISFKYTASEKSLEVLTCKDPEEKTVFFGEKRFTLFDEAGQISDETEPQQLEYECTVKSIELSPTGGKIDIEFFTEKNIGIRTNMTVSDSGENELFLVLNDGSHIPAAFNGYTGKNDDGLYRMNIRIAYRNDEDFQKYFIDISEVCALSFNGVEYPVE